MFNNYLSDFLVKNSISQSKFAQLIGVSQMSISRYTDEVAPAMPRADVWGKIAEAISTVESLPIDIILERMYQSLRDEQ